MKYILLILLLSCSKAEEGTACDIPLPQECPECESCEKQVEGAIKRALDICQDEVEYIQSEKGRCTGCGWESSHENYYYDITCYSGGTKIFSTKINTEDGTAWDYSDSVLTISDPNDIETIVSGNCVIRESAK